MTDQQILEKAIAKAVENGYDDKAENFESIYKLVIFNHDFAKALWGEDPKGYTVELKDKGKTVDMPNWKRHLQQMVIADDPIKYLGENI